MACAVLVGIVVDTLVVTAAGENGTTSSSSSSPNGLGRGPSSSKWA